MAALVTPRRKLAVIVSRGGHDEAYPALVLASAACQSDLEVLLFFTFRGLDVVTEAMVDHLHGSPGGNAQGGLLAALPGMEALAARRMKQQLDELELPTVREMLGILDGSGAALFACELAMRMWKRKREDLVAQVRDVLTTGDFLERSEGGQVIFT
jgi:peroxiredoxin family protein